MNDNLREKGARQDYDLAMVNDLLDFIEEIEKTEHGMDGAVREIARRAEAIRGPIFRSGRTDAALRAIAEGGDA